jgi:hypothetical protein
MAGDRTKAQAWMETTKALQGNPRVIVSSDDFLDLSYYIGRMLLFLFRVMICSPVCEHARSLQLYFGKGMALDGKSQLSEDTYFLFLQRYALVTHLAGGTVNEATMLAKLRTCQLSNKNQAAIESWIVSNPSSSLANLASYMDDLVRKDNEPNLLRMGMEKALQRQPAPQESRAPAAGAAVPTSRNNFARSAYPPAARTVGSTNPAPVRNFVPRAARNPVPAVAANVVEPAVATTELVADPAEDGGEDEVSIAAAAVAARTRKPATADSVCDNCGGKGHYASECPRPIDVDKISKARNARAAAYVARPNPRPEVPRPAVNAKNGTGPPRREDGRAEVKGTRPPPAAFFR